MGRFNALIRLVQYGDYQCPAAATASVVARTNATLYVLDEATFRTLVQNRDAVLRIIGAMTDREAADRLFGKRSTTSER